MDSDSENEDEDNQSVRNHLQSLVDKIIHLKRRMSGLPEEIVNKPGRNQSLLALKNDIFHYFGITFCVMNCINTAS